MPLSAKQRKERASIAAHASWARTPDRSARTKPARDAYEASFIARARELRPDVTDEAELKKIAKNIRGEEEARARFEASKRRGRGK